MKAVPQVAIVILNWNGRAFLQQFLPSVLATTYENLRVIVADNASTDDSISFLQSQYPQIERITFSNNHGFAQGYNLALQRVEADYFVLLNSDVEVTPGWLQPIIEKLETSETYAAGQPKICSYKSKSFFEYAGAAGGWIDNLGYPFARGRIFDVCEEDQHQYDETTPVFWASGAALVIRRTAFEAVIGFDPFFFAHQEEIDLCWRLQLQGFRLFCCPQSVVYHVGGGTLPKGHSRKTFLNFRNNLIMLAKNLHPAEAWWKIPFRLFLDQVSALKGLLGGDAGYFVTISKAHAAFARWYFSNNRHYTPNRKKLTQLAGVYEGNIVWQHFVRKKKSFAQIVDADKKNQKTA